MYTGRQRASQGRHKSAEDSRGYFPPFFLCTLPRAPRRSSSPPIPRFRALLLAFWTRREMNPGVLFPRGLSRGKHRLVVDVMGESRRRLQIYNVHLRPMRILAAFSSYPLKRLLIFFSRWPDVKHLMIFVLYVFKLAFKSLIYIYIYI